MHKIIIQDVEYETELEGWQIDYIICCFDDTETFLKLKTTSPVFETEAAQMFKTGWEACYVGYFRNV